MAAWALGAALGNTQERESQKAVRPVLGHVSLLYMISVTLETTERYKNPGANYAGELHKKNFLAVLTNVRCNP